MSHCRFGVTVCNFLRDFFRPRTACVVVQGSKSKQFVIANQVYQGTVLGPPAWNIFFRDVADPVREAAFSEDLFADDLSCERTFHTAVSNTHLHERMQHCQSRVHSWGGLNRVVFDPGKEQFVIVHPFFGEGKTFKYLGVRIDAKLNMIEEIH